MDQAQKYIEAGPGHNPAQEIIWYHPKPSTHSAPPEVHGAAKIERALESVRSAWRKKVSDAARSRADADAAVVNAKRALARYQTKETAALASEAQRALGDAELLHEAVVAAFDRWESDVSVRTADIALLAQLDERQANADALRSELAALGTQVAQLTIAARDKAKTGARDLDSARSKASDIAESLGIAWAPSRTNFDDLRRAFARAVRETAAGLGYAETDFLRLVRP